MMRQVIENWVNQQVRSNHKVVTQVSSLEAAKASGEEKPAEGDKAKDGEKKDEKKSSPEKK